MRVLPLLMLMAVAACSQGVAPGPGPRQIRLVGATAGLPFAEDVAERYTLSDDRAIAPLAQADDSASGIARFCGGRGPTHPDLVIATRPMTLSERRDCETHGVANVTEARFGWSALVIVAAAEDVVRDLTSEQISAALRGPSRNWSAIDRALPDRSIMIFGPARSDDTAWTRTIRHDGNYHPLGADADLVASTVARTPGSMGVVPYPYAAHAGRRAIAVDGVVPTPATIASGRYRMRMPLFLIVKTSEIPTVPGLRELLSLFASSLDPGGPFTAAGLVPLDGAGRNAARRALAIPAAAA